MSLAASPSLPSSDPHHNWRKRRRETNPNPHQNPLDLDEEYEEHHQISDFPSVVRRTLNFPHPSLLFLIAAERQQFSEPSASARLPFLENISHGQLQSLSLVLPDHPSLQPPDVEKPSAYVCTPPPLMEGKGSLKPFGNDQFIFVPMHSG